MRGYSEALEYLFGLEKFGTIFGLENIRWLLALIGNPHEALRAIHVGGTNGKGSVARMLWAILRQAGYRTGIYTSPHLLSFTERIAVNESQITQEEVAELTTELRLAADQLDRDRFFTFFDFTTALAFEHFRRNETDVAVVEVGLGGRLDSTNVLTPLLSVVTNVAMDHADYLGDSIEAIAHEKAGIIKIGVPAVTGAEGVGLDILETKAHQSGSRLYSQGRDFSFCKTADGLMEYEGLGSTLPGVSVNLRGDHQLDNAALALCSAEVLSGIGFDLPEKALRDGLSSVEWPGRLEVVREGPTVLLDGAHNPHAARALAVYVRAHYGAARKILVFGAMKDKDTRAMLEQLLPLAETVILTSPAMDRAAPPATLARFAPGALLRPGVRSALETAKALAGDDDVILVTGSLFTVGEAKKYIDEIL